MTRDQIISYAQSLTERKLTTQIDFNQLFSNVEQEFCAEHRFWWRKKSLTFQTAPNQSTYDLTSPNLVITPANAGPYVEEITKVFYIDSSNNVNPLEPVTDDCQLMNVIADVTTTDAPATWSPDTTDLTLFQTIRIGPIPNGTYTIYVFFWAMPNFDPNTTSDAITIIPSALHHVLVTAMEKEVWRLVYGTQDPKYVTALNLYNKKVAAAQLKPSFWSGKSNYFMNQDNEAIRSTRSGMGGLAQNPR